MRFQPEVVTVKINGHAYYQPAARMRNHVIVGAGYYGTAPNDPGAKVKRAAKEFTKRLNEVLATGLFPAYGRIW